MERKIKELSNEKEELREALSSINVFIQAERQEVLKLNTEKDILKV